MMLMADPSDSGMHEPGMTCSIGVHDATQRVREARLIASCRVLLPRRLWSAAVVTRRDPPSEGHR